MAAFTEASAQLHRDSQLNAHLSSLDADAAQCERADELVGEIIQDRARVSELIGDDAAWLCDAAAEALATGDWLGLGEMVKRHALPLVRTAAQEDAAAERAAARDDAGEARWEAQQDARAFG